MNAPLTRELIQAATVGPVLDALVAEHVMEWAAVYMDNPNGEPTTGPCGIPPNRTIGLDGLCIIAAYSTDLTAAGLVLERMSGGCYDAKLTRHNNGWWRAEFSEPSREYIAEGASLPEAISRAALLAVIAQREAQGRT